MGNDGVIVGTNGDDSASLNGLTSWRYALASAVGTSHSRTGGVCQDAASCVVVQNRQGAPVLVAVVSDGAGSAVNGGIGARLACELFVREIAAVLETDGDVADVTHELIQQWLSYFQTEVHKRAEEEGLTARDYACTFLAAVIGVSRAVFTQVGDGGIVASWDGSSEYVCLFWPQRGEYENVTNFATDPTSLNIVLHKTIDWAVDQVALFSDGLQRLALHYESRTAFSPFFRPMFAPLQQAQLSEGQSDQLSNSLFAFLNSPAVNNRTDDDKSLILASRRVTEVTTTVIAKSPGSSDALF